MTLNELYRPIGPQIDSVKSRLQALAGGYSPTTAAMTAGFFQRPGKLLRPALLHFSALAARGAGGPVDRSATEVSRLADAALAVELVHGASLVHDDILDDETERRGAPTVHGAWGIKKALLVGDALYSRAFGLLAGSLNAELLGRVTRMIEAMCQAEIEQDAAPGALSREQYLFILEGKTAGLMAVSCRIGAALAGAGDATAEVFDTFGRHFGLAYQLLDDVVDGDARCTELDGLAEAQLHLQLARDLLGGLPDSPGRQGLLSLLDLVGGSPKNRGEL